MRTLLVIVACLALAGCNRFARSGSEAAPLPQETVRVGTGLGVVDDAGEAGTPADGEATPLPATGSFVLQIVDQNDGHPAAIPVVVRGPRAFSLRSDETGTVRVEAPAGHYTAEAPAGCSDVVLVEQGDSGRLAIAAGRKGSGQLRVVWRHRYAPAPPVFSSIGPYWPVGTQVKLRYDVHDRCGTSSRPLDTPYPTFRFEPAANLEVVGTPRLRSDADGFGSVTVRCTAEGPTSLVVLDTANPPDRFDLVDADYGSFAGEPRCGSFTG